MVTLVTGASHTGKTALAQALLERYHWPYLSMDHLKMGLIRSGHTHLPPMSAPEDFTRYLSLARRQDARCILMEDRYEIDPDLFAPGRP